MGTKSIMFRCCAVVAFCLIFAVGSTLRADPPEWASLRITDDEENDRWPEVSGTNVVWVKGSGTDAEIYFYHGATRTTTRITNNVVEDKYPRLCGSNIVWRTNNHLYYCCYPSFTPVQISTSQNAPPPGGNDYRIDGNYIVWAGTDDSFDPTDIYLYNISSGQTTTITHNDYEDSECDISGNYVVWKYWFSGNYLSSEIYLYRIDTGQTFRLTHDSKSDRFPRVDGPHVIWWMDDHLYGAVDMYNIDTGVYTHVLTSATTPMTPDISGNYLAWKDGSYRIKLYTISSGLATTIVEDYSGGFSLPEISGSTLVWARSGTIYVYDIPSAMTTPANDWQQHRGDHFAVSGPTVVYEGDITSEADTEIFMFTPPVCNPSIPADLSGDCRVNLVDFQMFCASWLDCDLFPSSACDP